MRPAPWRAPDPPRADFFAAKGVLAALLDTLRVRWATEQAAEPFLHPGPRRGGARRAARRSDGWARCIRSSRARGTSTAAAAFELDLDRLAELAAERLETLRGRHELPGGARGHRGRRARGRAGGAGARDRARGRRSAARRAEVFDVYHGAQVGEGRVSLALALEFRAPDRTLTDDEVAERRAAIAAALRDELGGELRG